MSDDQKKEEVNVMLDLETVGTSSNAGILCIGATAFMGMMDIFPPLYERISPASLEKKNFIFDKGTLEWWETQDIKVREEAFGGTTPIELVLEVFTGWLKSFGEDKKILLWGNGSDFDNAILADAYDLCGMETPFTFRNNRCFRTLKNLTQAPEQPFVGDKHNALADARHQAIWAENIFKFMHLKGVRNHGG